MATTHGLMNRIAPDCIVRWQRAAQMRFGEAETLLQNERRLAALYWYGFSVELCLAAAYFRNAGFRPNDPIDRDTRFRRMSNARQRGLMGSDPHPLPGWAELLRWQVLTQDVDSRKRQLLDAAVKFAHSVYRHWRPELRYKVTDVPRDCLDEVRQAAKWFIDNQAQF